MSRRLAISFTRSRVTLILVLALFSSILYGFLPKLNVSAKGNAVNSKAAQDIRTPNVPVIAPGSAYRQVNLISDIPGMAPVQDPLLVNPWGITVRGTSPFWIANNGTSTTQIVKGDVGGAPLVLNPATPGPQTVTIPGGLPTGAVGNSTSDFQITPPGGGSPAASIFIFDSITGNITAWNGAQGLTAKNVVSLPGHVYTGLAIGSNSGGNRLYAADFANNHIDVFDGTFTATTVTGGFIDPTIPAGYAPFNVQNLGGSLYVAYAKVAPGGDSEEGDGLGYVRKFNTDGVRDLMFAINNGQLNSPWGQTIAPASFGIFGGALLVGNFSDEGHINAYNPTTGAFLGTLVNEANQPVSIEHLWALQFGNGGNGGDVNTLYFTAGTADEEHGLFGKLNPTTAQATSLIQFATGNFSIDEAGGHVDFTVLRTGDTSGTATINYNTFDASQAGHASQKSDYEIALGKITFNPGETSKTFRVLITDDKFVEGAEVLDLSLSNPVGAGVGLGTPSHANVTILDNDSTPPASNIFDDPFFFVRQHYLDFFNREPDTTGLNAFVNQLTACGSNTTCINTQRVLVSNAFFNSPEFQGNGSLVSRTFKASFGPSAFGSPSPILYGQFELGLQTILKDVITGAPGADALLESNKQTFFSSFVSSPQFISTFPTTRTPAQFVDALFANAGVSPSTATRQAAIDEFGMAADTSDQAARARAVRDVAENSAFAQAEASRNYVLLAYFGYLRRDPDTTSFNFLFNRLNSFGGDINRANLVLNFLTTPETRQRFGSDPSTAFTNQTPVANNDTATTTSAPVTINVLANDVDPDGDYLFVSSVTPGTGGTPAISSDGKSVVFTPTVGFTGMANFQYTVTDNGFSCPGGSCGLVNSPDPKTASATVTVNVTSSAQFANSTYTVDEGAGSVAITVTRTGDSSTTASVDFRTVPDPSITNCASVTGHASERCDYEGASGTLVFLPGEIARVFQILITDDLYVEGNETFNIELSNAKGTNFSLGGAATTTVTITDNDSVVATTNPLDTPTFFVRQQYLDFLNREPDQGGLDFWSGRITSCGSDPVCINREKVSVSSAFFLSNEFQNTGFFVYLMYRAAFDGPAGSRPTLAEFTRDRSQLIAGPALEVEKQALIADFITRPEFVAAYPVSMTNAQYVDALNANTGNSLTQAQRDALVNGLNSSTETRASVLRAVVDNTVFRQKEFNNAFVLTEYFGYLRRDADAGGYAFWLNVLNTTNNSSSMVCAFVNSGEYQLRFSPIITHNDTICSTLGP